MSPTIQDIVALMETIAPQQFAEEWDNVGLQTGSLTWPVAKIWVALEPSLHVVQAACQDHADLLITHHPLLFKPLTRVDYDSVLGQILQLSLNHRLGIFAAHTNYDSVRGGLNDVLAQHIGLRRSRPLVPAHQSKLHRVCVYLPTDTTAYLPAECPDGIHYVVYGNPHHATFRLQSERTKPSNSPSMVSFEQKQPNSESWLCHEYVISKTSLKDLLAKLQSVMETHGGCCHIHRLLADDPDHGIGRIGKLKQACRLKDLMHKLKTALNLQNIKAAGDPEMVVENVALCTGSGSGLLKQFVASPAQVYITGDLRYHEACTITEIGKGLIDIGHFGSEILITNALSAQLDARLCHVPGGEQVSVIACNIEKDPFWY